MLELIKCNQLLLSKNICRLKLGIVNVPLQEVITLCNTENTSGESDKTKTAGDTLSSPSKMFFRQEAVEHLTVRQYGTVIITRPISHLAVTGAFLTLTALIISFFIFFETTRKAPIQGMLVPTGGVTKVFSGQLGVIKEIHIKEGQYVHKGDVLFVVSSERSTQDRQSTEARVSQLLVERRESFRIELEQVRKQARYRHIALQQHMRGLQSEVKRLDSQAQVQQQRLKMSQEAVTRFVQLKQTNYISAAQLQEREAEVLDQQQRLLEIERIRSTVQSDLARALAEEQDIQVQALRDANGLHRSASALEQDLTENEARRENPIRALRSGTITTIAANLGQTVGTVTSLASILPEGKKLEAEMYVPSHAIGFIKPGMTALLRYRAFPYQKFGQHSARVLEVTTTSVRADELLSSAALLPGANQLEPVYRIRLELAQQTVQAYGVAMPLRSGMLVDASIMLERRKLYEWILEPVFSISGRM